MTCVWGKIFIQQAKKRTNTFGKKFTVGSNSNDSEGGNSCPNTCQTERAFSLVNGSLAVDGSGKIDVVTPSHRLQFLVEVTSELSHDKWLKVLAQPLRCESPAI